MTAVVPSLAARRLQLIISRHGFMQIMWALLALGVAIRLILAFTTTGQAYDLQSYALVDEALHKHLFGVYHQLDDYSIPPYGRWPYPPGFFLVIWPTARLAHVLGISFTSLIRVPSIISDAGIAWLVQEYLRGRRATEQLRLMAVALVALGPSFIAISGYHGQLDSVAFLPCVAATFLWTRTDADWRPFAAGALIGIGAAIKTVPVLMLLALAPTARSRREAVQLVATGVLIPLAAFAPWLVFDGPGKSLVWRYRGGPGLGGISLLTNPALPLSAFNLAHAGISGATKVVYDNARWITGGAVAMTAALVLRRRPPAVDCAVLLWLVVWTFGVSFFLQYMVWGLPFLLMAGYVRWVLILELVLLPPTLVTYVVGVHAWQVWLFYTAPMIALWVAWLLAVLIDARRIADAPSAVQTA